jgi:hypothetical protein
MSSVSTDRQQDSICSRTFKCLDPKQVLVDESCGWGDAASGHEAGPLAGTSLFGLQTLLGVTRRSLWLPESRPGLNTLVTKSNILGFKVCWQEFLTFVTH